VSSAELLDFKMINNNLKGRTALVTGAPVRIGRAISLALAAEGINVVAHHFGMEPKSQELVKEISNSYGVKSWEISSDFSRPDEYETLIMRVMEITGGFDILINNASSFSSDTLETVDLRNISSHMQINAWAPFVLCRDFARAAKHGHIINILDARIEGYDWEHVSYILSKHLLGLMTKMLAVKFSPDITVNGIAPGAILAPVDKMDAVLPKRHGGTDDIAQAVTYLLKNDYINGQVLYVDGGRHLTGETNG